jgi:hypothetical protein
VTNFEILKETPTTAVVDVHDSIGTHWDILGYKKKVSYFDIDIWLVIIYNYS